MNFIDRIKERAKSDKKRIVLPESMDKRVIEAAEKILREDLAEVVIVGKKEDILEISQGYDISKAIIVDPFTEEYTEELINELVELRKSKGMTYDEAMELLGSMSFDLIICMPGTGDGEGFDTARSIKRSYPATPMVILTPFSHGITRRIMGEDLTPFDYVFCWLGNTDLLLSIIKLIEDKMNLEHDVKEVGVQLILLVEDSIRFYSSTLPNLYKFVLKLSYLLILNFKLD